MLMEESVLIFILLSVLHLHRLKNTSAMFEFSQCLVSQTWSVMMWSGTSGTGSGERSPEFSLWAKTFTQSVFTNKHSLFQSRSWASVHNRRRTGRPCWWCRDVLAAGLGLGQDGQEEGRRLVGMEGGRDDHVVSRLQCQQLHHFPSVHEGLRLGDGLLRAEERGREFPPVCPMLWQHRTSQVSNTDLLNMKWMLKLWKYILPVLSPGSKSDEKKSAYI